MGFGRAIAIDFDGTITKTNEYPNIGEIRPHAVKVIKALQKRGYFCYLWTCRTGQSLENAIRWLAERGIILDSYNDGPSTGSLKRIASVYIDDAAYPNKGEIDWLEVARYFNITNAELNDEES